MMIIYIMAKIVAGLGSNSGKQQIQCSDDFIASVFQRCHFIAQRMVGYARQFGGRHDNRHPLDLDLRVEVFGGQPHFFRQDERHDYTG